MGDYNDPFDNNNQQPDNSDTSAQQQSEQQSDQQQNPYYQPQYQQPQYTGQTQYQQRDQSNQQQNQQQYQQYQQFDQFQQPRQKKFSGLALASLICGGASFLLSCCLFYVTWASSIVGIILGIVCLVGNRKKGIDNQNDKVMSIIGIILSAVSLLLAITLIAVVVISGDSFMNLTNSSLTSY